MSPIHLGHRGGRARGRLSRARLGKGQYLADLFAGCRAVSRAAEAQGFRARSWDVIYDAEWQDLLRPAVLRAIKADARSGRLVAAVLAPPCQTFSLARDRSRPVRSRELPWGFLASQLTPDDAIAVLLGNRLAQSALTLFRSFVKLGIPTILEHPLTSRLWHTAEICDLSHNKHVSIVELDQCQFGAKWKKATRLLCAHVNQEDLTMLSRRCKPVGCICSRAKKPHWQLSGGGPGGLRRTRIASEYPPQLARAIVSTLLASSVEHKAFHSHPFSSHPREHPSWITSG